MAVIDALNAPPELPGDVRWMQWGARVLTALAVIVLAALALRWVIQRPALNWQQIRVEGEVTRNSLATLRANALPLMSGNFITMDLAKTREAFEAVPWVRHAVVRRVWPAQLLVILEEHRPVATWDARGDWGEQPLERALLNSYGEVFHANLGEVEDDGLPHFAGPTGAQAQVLRLWQRLEALRASNEDAAVVRLELSGRGSWRATWASGAVVEIGRGREDELISRYQSFLAHAQAVARRYSTHIQSADLRHTDGYALKLVGIGTQSPKTTQKNPAKRKP